MYSLEISAVQYKRKNISLWLQIIFQLVEYERKKTFVQYNIKKSEFIYFDNHTKNHYTWKFFRRNSKKKEQVLNRNITLKCKICRNCHHCAHLPLTDTPNITITWYCPNRSLTSKSYRLIHRSQFCPSPSASCTISIMSPIWTKNQT